ncbi:MULTISPECIES: DoxX family protein [Rhodanobacter]|uniref:DoxX family protein n=1 Tax=Rhodanobacter TaxID=75309 RepID=UPI0004080E7C|nr:MULTISPECIES: DoxX family protein [Rhodanobacter]TAN19311.1 MAG: DoxX family protein [Rhodanobacter sp.]UJJ53792.1 DoxX family protein [Rhodanobacter thiooxydans]
MQGSADLGKLVLRITLGVLILFHGVSKLIHGPGYVLGVVTGAGLPSFVAYGAYVGEVVAPLLLLVGYWTRVGALIIVVNMLFAIGLVHMGQLATLADTGGWALELQGMFLGTALAIMLLGAGRYSFGGSNGRWN